MCYKPVNIIWIMAALMLLQAPSTHAEDSKSKDNTSENISINFSLKEVEQADVDNTAASTGYTETAASVEWSFLLLDMDHRSYKWEGHDFLGTTEPFSELTQLAPALQYYQKVGEHWSLWAKGTALIGFEDTLSSDAITYNPQLIAFYSIAQGLDLYCGAGVLYHPVDTTFYPVFGLAWNMEKKQGLFGVLGFPETVLRYELANDLTLKLDILWENRIYQFKEDNTIAPEGYLKIEDLLPGLHLEYEPLDNLLLSIGVRHYFERQLTFFDQNEEEIGEYEVESSWAYLFKVGYTF